MPYFPEYVRISISEFEDYKKSDLEDLRIRAEQCFLKRYGDKRFDESSLKALLRPLLKKGKRAELISFLLSENTALGGVAAQLNENMLFSAYQEDEFARLLAERVLILGEKATDNCFKQNLIHFIACFGANRIEQPFQELAIQYPGGDLLGTMAEVKEKVDSRRNNLSMIHHMEERKAWAETSLQEKLVFLIPAEKLKEYQIHFEFLNIEREDLYQIDPEVLRMVPSSPWIKDKRFLLMAKEASECSEFSRR